MAAERASGKGFKRGFVSRSGADLRRDFYGTLMPAGHPAEVRRVFEKSRARLLRSLRSSSRRRLIRMRTPGATSPASCGGPRSFSGPVQRRLRRRSHVVLRVSPRILPSEGRNRSIASDRHRLQPSPPRAEEMQGKRRHSGPGSLPQRSRPGSASTAVRSF